VAEDINIGAVDWNYTDSVNRCGSWRDQSVCESCLGGYQDYRGLPREKAKAERGNGTLECVKPAGYHLSSEPTRGFGVAPSRVFADASGCRTLNVFHSQKANPCPSIACLTIPTYNVRK
jgi:hypothetical protein